MTFRRFAGASCLAVLAACTPRPPVVAPPELASESEPYAAVQRRDASVHALRARFTVAMRAGKTDRRSEGVLLVKKPDRFRLRLLSLLGFTVLDYTSTGQHARMELPLEGERFVDDEIERHAPFSPADMRQVFLHDEDPTAARCVSAVAQGDDVVVLCHGHDDVIERRLVVDRPTATVRQETVFSNGAPRLVLWFDDYRRVDDILLPFAIDLEYPGKDVLLRIDVRGYEVNPVLSDSLFDGRAETGRGS